MNFQELGLTLRREREKRGLTVEAVMEATKISRINIVALEEGSRSGLPHPVYTKGFVKSYARLLGLDGDELAMVVDREYQDHEDMVDEVRERPQKAEPLREPSQPPLKKKPVWPAILICLLLIAGAVFALINFTGKGGEKSPAVTESQPSETVPAETPAVAPAPETEGDQPTDDAAIVDQPDQSAVVADEAPVKEEATAKPEEKTEVKPKKEKPQDAAAKAAATVKNEQERVDRDETTTPDQHQYDHVLVIRATTEKGCWIGVWQGDETNMARDFVLKQGEPLRLMFNSPRRIRIGNAAGVSVLYNGKPYPLDDAKGNIQTLRFGMD